MKRLTIIVLSFIFSLFLSQNYLFAQENGNIFFRGQVVGFSLFGGYNYKNTPRPANFDFGIEYYFLKDSGFDFGIGANSSWFEISGKNKNEITKQNEFFVFYPELIFNLSLSELFSLRTGVGYGVYGKQNNLGGNTQWVLSSDRNFNPFIAELGINYQVSPILSLNTGMKFYLGEDIYQKDTVAFNSSTMPFFYVGVKISLPFSSNTAKKIPSEGGVESNLSGVKGKNEIIKPDTVIEKEVKIIHYNTLGDVEKYSDLFELGREYDQILLTLEEDSLDAYFVKDLLGQVISFVKKNSVTNNNIIQIDVGKKLSPKIFKQLKNVVNELQTKEKMKIEVNNRDNSVSPDKFKIFWIEKSYKEAN